MTESWERSNARKAEKVDQQIFFRFLKPTRLQLGLRLRLRLQQIYNTTQTLPPAEQSQTLCTTAAAAAAAAALVLLAWCRRYSRIEKGSGARIPRCEKSLKFPSSRWDEDEDGDEAGMVVAQAGCWPRLDDHLRFTLEPAARRVNFRGPSTSSGT
jgi:hypothetical protein